MTQSVSRVGSRPLHVDFDRTKYGRELLIDAACVHQMPSFIDDCVPHTLGFHDILLVTRGRGELILDGTRHTISPGVVIFCLPGQVREWRLKSALDGACLFFVDEFVADTFSDAHFLDQFAFFRSPRSAAALALDAPERKMFRARFATMQRELANFQSDGIHALRAALYAFLVMLNRWYVARHGVSATPVAHECVERFQRMIERDFRRRHRVADYASALGVSPGHLNVLCKSHARVNAAELIRARIVLEARRLLLHGNLGAAQVADHLGFDDPAYFSRFFRREAGAKPSRFRRSR